MQDVADILVQTAHCVYVMRVSIVENAFNDMCEFDGRTKETFVIDFYWKSFGGGEALAKGAR